MESACRFSFGAVVSGALVRACPVERSGSLILLEEEGCLRFRTEEFRMEVALEEVETVVVHPSAPRLCVVFEHFPRFFPPAAQTGSHSGKLPLESWKHIWCPERTLVVKLLSTGQPNEWEERLQALVPTVKSGFEIVELPPVRLPSQFQPRYLLEVLQWESGHRLTQDAADRLASLDGGCMLAEVASLVEAVQKDSLTSLKQLSDVPVSGTPRSSAFALPRHHVVRHCTVTALAVVPEMPRLVEGKRLLELAAEAGLDDYLLAVSFEDINGERMSKEAEPAVKRAFECGLDVCGRTYQFLAASSDQLRHGGGWFLCEDNPGRRGVGWLREKIGDLSHLRLTNVSKYLARLGMSLTTSRPAFDATGMVEVAEDAKNGEHCFTDGCGEMSSEAAGRLQRSLGLPQMPSAVQVRLGGAKGMLVLNRQLEGCQVRLRRSMVKFESSDRTLRVVSVPATGRATLNHDVLTLLGPHVPREKWHGLLQKAIVELARPLFDADLGSCESYLMERFDAALAAIAGRAMWRSLGANPLNDPFMLEVLRGSYLASVMDLCERMHVPVESSALLVGVADPSGTLRADEVAVACRGESVLGQVLVLRYPASHPGDVRRLRAVRKPELSGLDDVIVFSVHAESPGALPQFAKCSGGDLDGDLYAVFFDLEPDEDIPQEDGRPATDPLSRPLVIDPAEVQDYVDFGKGGHGISEAQAFLRVALNDALGQASNAHKALADQSCSGVYDPKCRLIAALGCLAVDSPKTGNVITVREELRATSYPDWMMNPRKPAYASERVLGELFRSVRGLSAVSILTFQSQGDYEQGAYVHSDGAPPDLVEQAKAIYEDYRTQVRLAVVGWRLRSEHELLVGPLRRVSSQREARRHRERTEKTQAVFSQICEGFAGRFDAFLAESQSSLAEAVRAWWAADATGCSAFRWIPWRLHAGALKAQLAPPPAHRDLSFPLVRLGQEVQKRAGSAQPVVQVVRDFLQSQIAALAASAGASSKVAEQAASTCAAVLMERAEEGSLQDALAHADGGAADRQGLHAAQELGSRLVDCILEVARLARSLKTDVSSALAIHFAHGREAERMAGHVARLLSSHAHRIPVSLDLECLFRPIELHNHRVVLTQKQLQTIAVSKSFVQGLRQSVGGNITVRTHKRRLPGRIPVWSLHISGTLAQVIAVERELERTERAPLKMRGQALLHASTSLQLRRAVDSSAGVRLLPLSKNWRMHPVHARRCAPAFALNFAGSVGSYTGEGRELADAISHAATLIELGERVEIAAKVGTFYVISPPDNVLGEKPARQLLAHEALELLSSSRDHPAAVEIVPGRGKRKPWIISFLKSGFSACLAQPPRGFCPSETCVSVRVRVDGEAVALTLADRAASVTDVSKGERRLLTFTALSEAPSQSASCSGDLRVNVSADVPVGPAEELFELLVADQPVSLHPDRARAEDWYLHLRTSTAGGRYEFEAIRVQLRSENPMPHTGGFVRRTSRVISLLPDGAGGVAVESEDVEIGAFLHLGLAVGDDFDQLVPGLQAAVGQLTNYI